MKTGGEQTWKTYKCCQCGKVFDALPDWAYFIEYGHRYRKMFCRWSCIQAYRREHPERVYKKYQSA